MNKNEGFWHEGFWIPHSTKPVISWCPVCLKYYDREEHGLCPECKCVLLAQYTGNWIPIRVLRSFGLID